MEQILFRLCTRSTEVLDLRPRSYYAITQIYSIGSHEDPVLFAPVTSLYFAAYHGLHQILKWLVDRGQNVREEGGFFGTPLHAACFKGNLDAAILLLDHGADIDSTSRHVLGATVLQLASQNGHMKIVEFLLDRGASVDIEDEFRSTPMIDAARHGHFDIVEVLLDHGADIDAATNGGINSLFMAVLFTDFLAVETLLDRGAQIHASSETEDRCLLLEVCARDPNEEGRELFEIATLLLDRGADINRKNDTGRAALIEAARVPNPGLLRLFLDRRADVFTRDKAGKTALDAARHEQERFKKGSSSYRRAQESVLILEEAEKAWLEKHRADLDQEGTQPSQPPL